MKSFIKFFLVVSMFITTFNSAYALNFEQAFTESNKTPMVVLLYADWADGIGNTLTQYREIASEFAKNFNFVELDIASKDAKAFNDKYHIYPKLPYVLMFRDGGKVSRYVHRECASDYSCLKSKLKTFIQ